MASLITRAVIMVSGYVYPAYECFKAVDKVRPDIRQLQFWCQYWIIIAMLTVFERLGDTFISWLPMYNEAKLAFIIYLWYPKTKGTTYVYTTFMRPLVAKHEADIDRYLNEFRTRAGDLAFHYWQRSSTYVQSRFLDVLQYLASQSPPAAPTAQPGQQQVPNHTGYRQTTPVYQEQQVAYPAQVPVQAQANEDYRPSAPVLPTGYEPGPPTAAEYQQQTVIMRQQSYEVREDVMEITDVAEPPVVPTAHISAPVQRSRSRSRSRSRRNQ